ncbi:MAG: HAMP domain-containing histidine kinase [Anaerolineae bacterium]|nr:HAMP domain-containing histidine kinase [Anaerolineae bacterium]
MSGATQSHLVTPTGNGGLRPTLDELLQNTRLLITLRWVAGFGILLATLFSTWVLSIDLRMAPLLFIGISVLFYNVLLLYLFNRPDEPTVVYAQRIAWGQIILDWLAMTALVHFTGGITSPALIYFVIHATLAGTVLLPWQSRILTVLAIAIIGGLGLLEREGVLPHITIPELEIDEHLHQNATYITAVLFFFGTVVLTLSELVMAFVQRLRQREERIRQLYDARSTFLRVATHELRAPLAAGLSLMRNIEQGYAGDFNEQQGAILKRVTERLDGLRMLIDDLLTFARIQEASASHVPLERVSLRAYLDKIIEREQPNADEQNVTLACHLSDDDGCVMAGEIGLAIIFGNLINNAIKYTPDGGQVRIDYTINRVAQTAEVMVADTGIGIPEAELQNIFTEFFRASNAKSAQITGTGIGLSTVHRLVERYRGKISLESEEGKGTTVHVSLPLAPHTALPGTH